MATLTPRHDREDLLIGWQAKIRKKGYGVCQGSCRVTHFLSRLFILPLRVQIYRTDGCPIACAA